MGVGTINELNDQMKLIQNFFEQQIILVDNGKSYEAKLNLIKGEILVAKFRATDNILQNKIDLR